MNKQSKDDVVALLKETEVKIAWEELDPGKPLTDQGADSLDMITILFSIQEHYGIQISDDSIADGEWASIEKMVANLNQLLK